MAWWGDGEDRVPDEGPLECEARDHPIPHDRECCACGMAYVAAEHKTEEA